MIVPNNHEHGQLISAKAGSQFGPTDTVISRTNAAGELLGGATYSGFTGASIFVHVAGFQPNWMNRGFLWAAFFYPFEQLKVSRLFGWIPSSNLKALEFNQKLGFNTITTIPGVFLDGDAIIMGMTRDQCRWLALKPRTLS